MGERERGVGECVWGGECPGGGEGVCVCVCERECVRVRAQCACSVHVVCLACSTCGLNFLDM